MNHCLLSSRSQTRTCPIPYPRLEGMKVIGDANVPTSKLSFVVALREPCDINSRLAADRRQVVSFPLDGFVITDLSHRQRHMVAWYRGAGQINRQKGKWD